MTRSRFSLKALALVFLAACQGPPAWETQSSSDLADTAFAAAFREGTGGGNTETPGSPLSAGTDGTSDVDDGPPQGVAELESIEADDPRIVTYRYRTNAIPLQCRTKVLFSVRIPLAGRTRARTLAVARLRLDHPHPTRARHFWSAAVHVGREKANREYDFAIGDNFCPGNGPFVRSNLGLGTLTADDTTVSIVGRIGSSACSNGSIWIRKGSVLEVMVFSEQHGRTLQYASWMKSNGLKKLFPWGTRASTISQVNLDAPTAGAYRVLAAVEGSPHDNPNKHCGRESHTLMSRILVNREERARTLGQVPASPRWGHLVRNIDRDFFLNAGRHAIELQVGKNFNGTVTTGGCCGDGVLVVYPY
jgi:hypothetical protein